MEIDNSIPYIKSKKSNIAVVNIKLGENKRSCIFRDNKTERMRLMKNYEEIMNILNEDLKGLVIEESSNSLIVTARKKIYIPEKKIILMDQMTEHGSQFLIDAYKSKGGLIV